MDRFRRTNPQNSYRIVQEAVEKKIRAQLAANVRNAKSTGLGRQPPSTNYKHLTQRRNKALMMQHSWNHIVKENVRLLKRTRQIALGDHLPSVSRQKTHKFLNMPYKLRQQKLLKKKNHAFGNKLYRIKSTIDSSRPKFMRTPAVRASTSNNGRRKQPGRISVHRPSKSVDIAHLDCGPSPFAPGRPFTGQIRRNKM